MDKIKLSEKQREVLKLAIDGWSIACGENGWFAHNQSLGRIKKLNALTCNGLQLRGFLKMQGDYLYHLTDAGREAIK